MYVHVYRFYVTVSTKNKYPTGCLIVIVLWVLRSRYIFCCAFPHIALSLCSHLAWTDCRQTSKATSRSAYDSPPSLPPSGEEEEEGVRVLHVTPVAPPTMTASGGRPIPLPLLPQRLTTTTASENPSFGRCPLLSNVLGPSGIVTQFKYALSLILIPNWL